MIQAGTIKVTIKYFLKLPLKGKHQEKYCRPGGDF